MINKKSYKRQLNGILKNVVYVWLSKY